MMMVREGTGGYLEVTGEKVRSCHHKGSNGTPRPDCTGLETSFGIPVGQKRKAERKVIRPEVGGTKGG